MAVSLRVYPASIEPEDATEAQSATVPVNLGDLLPLLALAHRKNYVWLHDFLDDRVLITTDLYEVLHSFRATRPSA